ncbi:hypothetical protein TPAR_02758 [Tolypocladium paradoxum]|uniref:Uncharacterized protein n=1 Tax=Tolypocladium paradoxum TaxID=94208 RepID=A0A2S4L3P4_9HYPO|nr:hypothetical protein TPAR_02758 [Tolypocladium paradoxum]
MRRRRVWTMRPPAPETARGRGCGTRSAVRVAWVYGGTSRRASRRLSLRRLRHIHPRGASRRTTTRRPRQQRQPVPMPRC